MEFSPWKEEFFSNTGIKQERTPPGSLFAGKGYAGQRAACFL